VVVETASAADPYSIVYSTTSNHADPKPLNGTTVNGTIYPFTSPDEGVNRVTFSLNGNVVRTENNAPYDFMGGSTTQAEPWDTKKVADGTHTISAEILLTNGSRTTLSATFTVSNATPPVNVAPTSTAIPATATPVVGNSTTYSIDYSVNSDRSGKSPLQGATVSGMIYAFTSPDEGVNRVTFSLNGNVVRTENNAPYDFMGSNTPWDTTKVADGTHTISAEIHLTNGSQTTVSATVTVSNSGHVAPPATQTPVPPTTEPAATPTTEPTATPTTPAQPGTTQPTLLHSYYSVSGQFAPDGFETMKYRPRQFASGLNINGLRVDNPGSFNGWDVFNPHHRLDTTMRIRLNRQATVSVVWMTTSEGPPSWLSSWQSAGTVSISGKDRSVYRKVLGAGNHDLGGFRYGNEPYLVLLAESNGSPSAAPATPAGKTAQQPNQLCQDWVHDLHVVTGPDGRTYRTWHPQIDPVYSCYFGHEHGNDPSSVAPGYKPLYGYVNHNHGLDEAHHGFKTYAFRDASQNVDWVITQHQGTSTRNVLCGRFHAVNVAAFQNGVKMADLHFMADFGTSRFAATNDNMTPPECPTQGDIKSEGLRRVPQSRAGSEDGYTPYIMNGSFTAIGLRMNAGFLTTDGRTGCPDKTCSQLHVNQTNTGSRRRLQVLDSGLTINRAIKTTSSGTFYTNGSADTIVAAGTANAVQQYIAPGFSADLRVARADRDGAKRNGMWAFNGEFQPLMAAMDGYDFKGSNPLLPLSHFSDAN
jgi:hypothetical protein